MTHQEEKSSMRALVVFLELKAALEGLGFTIQVLPDAILTIGKSDNQERYAYFQHLSVEEFNGAAAMLLRWVNGEACPEPKSVNSNEKVGKP
jgi:hypothetical protein